MEKVRKGKIALLLLKQILKEKRGVRLTPNFRREIGDQAKKIGIPFEELLQFTKELTSELFEETFHEA